MQAYGQRTGASCGGRKGTYGTKHIAARRPRASGDAAYEMAAHSAGDYVDGSGG